MNNFPVEKLIPESKIVIFSPHYDDVLFGLGGYILGLTACGLRSSKQFHIQLLFSRSNYQTGSGDGNFDTSLDRIKYATGKRLLEDMNCLDELLGEHAYRYELLGERECMLREKVLADSEMEFPHGMYEDFNEADQQIFARIQKLVRSWAVCDDTALIFPLAIKEHIDHFITREAGITVARELGNELRCRIYFQEDKPYAGIQTPEEASRIEAFVESNHLEKRIYRTSPEKIVELAFKHYVSQVDDIYRTGVLQRAEQLRNLHVLANPCDCLYVFPR